MLIMVDFYICCYFLNFSVADFSPKYKILRESSQYKVSDECENLELDFWD